MYERLYVCVSVCMCVYIYISVSMYICVYVSIVFAHHAPSFIGIRNWSSYTYQFPPLSGILLRNKNCDLIIFVWMALN